MANKRTGVYKPSGKPKTTEEVSFVTGTSKKDIDASVDAFIKSLYFSKSDDTAKKFLADLKKINASEKERLKILQTVIKESEKFGSSLKLTEQQSKRVAVQFRQINGAVTNYQESIDRANKVVAATKQVWSDVEKVLKGVHAETAKIYTTSHQMQLEANLTWGEYTKLYDSAYDQARRMNSEAGKAVHTARELVETQNKLLLEGWRGLDTSTVANLSGQVMLMQKTLGAFPTELSNAFQLSYRTLGEANNQFVSEVGNRLNAFQDTFGTNLAMFTNLISSMQNSNSFIARDNLNAQIMASESLIKTAALAGQIGIMSQNFLSELALISQYGTMEQMSTLYQGGALLQGFSTEGFQQQMLAQDYYGATTDLIRSIYTTLNNIDDHYLRAEYMQQIGGSFGLSQQDLLAIMNSGGQIAELDENIMDKLTDVETSMVDELRGLKVDLLDRIENFFGNTKVAQAYGRLMSEFGLFGVTTHLLHIQGLIVASMGKDSLGGALAAGLKGMFTSGGGSGGLGALSATGTLNPGGSSIIPAIGKTTLGVGGAYMGVMSNVNAYNTISNMSSDQSSGSSWITNLLGSTAGGAMAGSVVPGIGTAVGAGIGLATGIITGLAAESQRGMNSRKALDDQSRRERRALQENQINIVNTGDPAMDALISEVRGFRQEVSGQMDETLKFQVVTNMYNKTTTETR